MIKIVSGHVRSGTAMHSAGELLSLPLAEEDYLIRRGVAVRCADEASEPAVFPDPTEPEEEDAFGPEVNSLEKPLEEMTKRELENLAVAIHVDSDIIRRCKSKRELIEAIQQRSASTSSRLRSLLTPPSPVVAE